MHKRYQIENKAQYFVRLPVIALMDERLPRSALVVYAIMIDAASRQNLCEDLKISEISERSGLSTKTVRRAERVLMDCGYIVVHRTGRASTIEVLHDLVPMIKSTIETYREKEGTA